MALKKLTKNKPSVKKEVSSKKRANTVEQPKTERNDALDKQIQNQLEENTNVVKKTSGVEETLKSGTPNDHFNKHKANIVGLSKGITKNMDNYESLRVDCWVSVQVKEGEDPEKILDILSDAIDKRLELEVEKVIG